MLKGFRDFIARGNVIDLAVGVIIAGAFSKIVAALNDKVLMPLIGGLFGKPDFDRVWTIHMNGGQTEILPGAIMTAAVNFLIVAAALYFFVVYPINKMAEAKKRGEDEAAPVKTDETILLEEIRDLLKARES
ncbi:large conductance mechanosensitive channel protein MscL [Trueperella sp. LYQ143]|uniref:large conductance mechanosensitive channel protein MscL n=1 Tax=unclassified Trueperella TaxID=2630174 RepID=UPI003983BA3A